MARKRVRRTVHRYTRSFVRSPRKTTKTTIPLAPTLAIVSAFGSPIHKAMTGNIVGAIQEAKERITCFDDNGFRLDLLKQTYIPIAVGLILHKTVGKYVNPMLARANVPLIRI